MQSCALVEDKRVSDSFHTTQPLLFDLWDQLQTLQCDFAFQQELMLFHLSEQWHNAEKVLDIGCGNGRYLDLLFDRFPGKRYSGIDVSAELVEAAIRDSRIPGAHFQASNLFDYSGDFDVLLMRLFLQHLPNPKSVLEKAAELTRPGAAAFVIDSVDGYRHYHPDMPAFRAFFDAYRLQQRNTGLDRDVASRVPEIVASMPQWELGFQQDIVIPSSIRGNHQLFAKVFGLVVDMVETVGELDFPFAEVRKDLARWQSHGESYCQIALKLLRLDRV